jgi:hypothetical protein|uniref:Uncharacterized protein n=1 Tax=Picea glauca TaxID=3330 RepID=A0A117NGR9_PICGL|nr:hypothetical protein ABT39_MTgene6234 [Picea glauca]KUM48751.1 hypothetical protein ABT39_MTgene4087 [Picea glauca]KUM49717.1 hypothetical protein ABT39_MTgene2944 [Picea glauca]QHR86089.1 hypothetical protein Q903MT_gene87 [Picea sitchensis]
MSCSPHGNRTALNKVVPRDLSTKVSKNGCLAALSRNGLQHIGVMVLVHKCILNFPESTCEFHPSP